MKRYALIGIGAVAFGLAVAFAVLPVVGDMSWERSETESIAQTGERTDMARIEVGRRLYGVMIAEYGVPPWPCEKVKEFFEIVIKAQGQIYFEQPTIEVECER